MYTFQKYFRNSILPIDTSGNPLSSEATLLIRPRLLLQLWPPRSIGPKKNRLDNLLLSAYAANGSKGRSE